MRVKGAREAQTTRTQRPQPTGQKRIYSNAIVVGQIMYSLSAMHVRAHISCHVQNIRTGFVLNGRGERLARASILSKLYVSRFCQPHQITQSTSNHHHHQQESWGHVGPPRTERPGTWGHVGQPKRSQLCALRHLGHVGQPSAQRFCNLGARRQPKHRDDDED